MKSFSLPPSKLQMTVENLYKVFEGTRILTYPIGCIDYGGTKEELEFFISTPLRELPEEYISRLEFYDETWESWGNENEVKYFLPRIAECIAQNTSLLEYGSGPFSLFKYKMADLFNDGHSKWTKEEAFYLKKYLLSLFEFKVSSSANICDILYLLCNIADDMKPYLMLWQELSKNLKSTQISNWLQENIDTDSCLVNSSSIERNYLSNLNQVFKWVTSDENIVEIDIFHQDPWWKLACFKNI